MSTHNLMVLLLAVTALGAVSGVLGLLSYGVARAVGSPATVAIAWGGMVFLGAMTLFIALLNMLVTAVV
ncbi:hypothetical protein OG863_40740 [Streptomyces decoyicus]|uniref:Uncharacterized protein n=1 Tax=Streptomyces decoyicus TaxID=249567 RepID=A0ABZ1F871_9ACTN|nr:hypothetical protein [Streptomyces decoyicus]WSB66502.1 hypothetical protein OG863_00025 [Streptomyces decoyicus]WSB73755.1 hypothetical protein OG863_40740 [Streptomyces decoyicus]